ncbi:lmo0937 family membrane protein [Rasiella sp. SM2506]|uniref:lmo0937 family membrane protein n=1 Tax=Rasiella sp. SM2506 TaxID=3423914 RepID=UPI003D7A81BD
MRDLIWLIVVILIVGWLIGFIGFGAAVGNLIHILLVIAVIMIIFKLLTGKRL